MRICACDWKRHSIVYTFDGVATYECASPEQLLDAIADEPTRVFFEAPTFSFPTGRKWELVRLFQDKGHQYEVVSSRSTPRMLVELGFKKVGEKKVQGKEGDKLDAIAIWHLATSNYHTWVPTPPTSEWIAKRRLTSRRVMVFRNFDLPMLMPNRKKPTFYKNPKPLQDHLLRDILNEGILPPVGEEHEYGSVFTVGGVWSADVVNVIAWSAYAVSNKDEFVGLTGSWAGGYPTQMRATLKRHITAKSTVRAEGYTLADVKLGAKWMRHQFNPHRDFFDGWLDQASELVNEDLRDRAIATPEKGKINSRLADVGEGQIILPRRAPLTPSPQLEVI